MGGYLSLFLSAFVAATIFPLYSEVVFAGLLGSGEFDTFWLWLWATTGNTMGSMVNWVLGRWCLHWQDRKWFPFKARDLEKASRWYNKWGVWSLLLSWTPVIGDPITFAAGFLRVNFWIFTILVLIAKGGRYAAILLIAQGFL